MMVSTPRGIARHTTLQLSQPRGRSVRERAFAGVMFAATLTSVLVLGVLVADVVLDGIPWLSDHFFANYLSRFPEEAGIRGGLTGTLSLMLLVALFSFPLGVGAAIYLEEYANDNRFTRLMEANISNLAGVPSIVYGLLGLGVFVYVLEMGRSVIAAALTLTLLILPVIIVASREALRAVPRAIRDGGLALGATPLQVTFRQVVPAALPGMLTGTILGLSRAIGETAPILVVGAAFSRRADNVPWEPLERFTALPTQIYQWVSYPQAEFREGLAPAGIIVLLVVLLFMNSAAIILRNRYSRSW